MCGIDTGSIYVEYVTASPTCLHAHMHSNAHTPALTQLYHDYSANCTITTRPPWVYLQIDNLITLEIHDEKRTPCPGMLRLIFHIMECYMTSMPNQRWYVNCKTYYGMLQE